MKCPHCNQDAIAVREIGDWLSFFVHRSAPTDEPERVIVSGCTVTLARSVEVWSRKTFESARGGTSRFQLLETAAASHNAKGTK